MLLGCCEEVANLYDIEIILVDNGSDDNTPQMKNDMLNRYPFVRWTHLEKNVGYGNGIMHGLELAHGEYIGYTHADLQTDPRDFIAAIQKVESSSNNRVFVKGKRIHRQPFAKSFSLGFEKIASTILGVPFYEINAQPTLFHSDLLQHLADSPMHWGFDLYIYFAALQQNFDILRIDVVFSTRTQGSSKWNRSLFSRFRLSLLLVRYCFQLRREITAQLESVKTKKNVS